MWIIIILSQDAWSKDNSGKAIRNIFINSWSSKEHEKNVAGTSVDHVDDEDLDPVATHIDPLIFCCRPTSVGIWSFFFSFFAYKLHGLLVHKQDFDPANILQFASIPYQQSFTN